MTPPPGKTDFGAAMMTGDEGVMIYIIVAMTEEGIIGKEGKLPWKIPEEMGVFRALTMGNTVVMGRTTFESIGMPLAGRNNIVVSTTLPSLEGLHLARNLEEALQLGRTMGRDIFVMGGAELYGKAVAIADCLYVSWIHERYEGDVRFPTLDWSVWHLEQEERFAAFTLCRYSRMR